MIIFSPTVCFNVKVPLFFLFLIQFVSFFWVLLINLFFIGLYFFCLFIFLFFFEGGGGSLAYIFGCDLISYIPILLSL